jgi:undecaprenyl-diphosphatase
MITKMIRSHAANWKVATTFTVLLAVGGLVFLVIVTSQRDILDADLQIAQWVRSFHFLGLDPMLRVMNVLADGPMAITLWVIAWGSFLLRGRPLEAAAIFFISGIWVGNALINVMAGRPFPSPELDLIRTGSFPSGHVTGAVAFYGLLTFLTLKNVQRGPMRVIVPTLSFLIICLVSIGRVYVSAHWPSDILGSYLFAFIGLVAIALVYNSMKEDRFHLPRLCRQHPVPETPDGKRIVHSIASNVYLDPEAGTAIKEYKPSLPIRALYRLAFQAPFPYQHSKEALEAAVAKRKIAGLLTKHHFGQDMVAKVYEIRNGGNSYRFVTEFVSGTLPVSNKEIEGTLCHLYSYFQQVGLPTWQIAPGNPHAHSNFIRNTQGHLKLIDLESSLVSVSYPWKVLRAFLRDGYFPIFDDVDFLQLRGYVQNHAQELTESLGSTAFEELEQAIDSAEFYTRQWKESERRIWGRVARRAFRFLNVSNLIRGIRSRLDDAESMAKTFVYEAIDRWERNGQIDSERVASLRQMMSTSEVQTLIKHLGAHLVLSAVIVIPIPGLRSAARFTWTLTFRLQALYALSRGRITREEYQIMRSIHSIPVILLSLVPGLGAIAYVVSDTILKESLGRTLVDQCAHKLPFGLYRRLGLARITTPQPQQLASQP